MSRRSSRLFPSGVLVAALCAAGAATAAPNPALEQLAAGTVSRLEWGLERLRSGLVANFERDPLTLAPSTPPYFINVRFDPAAAHIVIEIGQTFAALDGADPKALCAEYVARVRAFLSVDRAGRPAIKGRSSLALEYFHPAHAPTPPAPEFATSLDGSVRVRGLVASPLHGVYSICTAALIDSPIRYID